MQARICYAAGFDPMLGFYHQPRFGRPALSLDLMEPFRPLVVDSAVVTAINTRMVSGRDFVSAGGGVALTSAGRKGFYRAYELRMDTLVTHPIFGYRVSYRRLLELQVRMLAKVLDGDVPKYPAFSLRGNSWRRVRRCPSMCERWGDGGSGRGAREIVSGGGYSDLAPVVGKFSGALEGGLGNRSKEPV